MTTHKILLIIPCYNCQLQIDRVLQDIENNALVSDQISQILIIENRSQDDTLKVAINSIKISKYKDKYKIIQNAKNVGLGGSQITGIAYGIRNGFHLAAVLHGDHQASFHELGDLIRAFNQRPECSAVLGSRFSKSSKLKNYSRQRIFGNRVLNLIYSMLTGTSITDLGSGINLFRLENLKNLPFDKFNAGFAWNMDLLLNLIERKDDFIFHPITWAETDQVSNASNIRVGLTSLIILLKWRIGLIPYSRRKNTLTPDFIEILPLRASIARKEIP